MGSWKFIKGEVDPKGDYATILTLERQPSRICKLFGKKPEVFKFIGDSTVWRNYDTFRRVGIGIELMLCDIEARYKYNIR